MKSPNARNARELAFVSVTQAMSGAAFAEDVIRQGRDALEARDRALATQIALGTLRRWHTLQAILPRVATFDRRRTPQETQCLVLTGAAQIIYLSGTPVHAAVDETVRIAKQRISAPASRMVNAVLRRLAACVVDREAEWVPNDARRVRVDWTSACLFNCDVLADSSDPTSHAAQASSETQTRFTSLAKRLGRDKATDVCFASSAAPPIVIQRNSDRVSDDDFSERLGSTDASNAILSGGAVFLRARSDSLSGSWFEDGLGYVQDQTARDAVRLLSLSRGERVLDLCAAPGGKTMAIALDVGPTGNVVACDISPERLARVEDNAQRLGLADRVFLRKLDRQRVDSPVAVEGPFDAVLVDVPCSNTGVIARRPEARFRKRSDKQRPLDRVQSALLRQGSEAVRPGGRLVYSTCSIEPDENESIIAAFLASAGDAWQLDEAFLTLPSWGPSIDAWRDGGYAARLVRRR